MSEWQPIETAPLTGRKVVLFYLNRSTARGVTTVIVWTIWACAGGLVGLLVWRQVRALGWL